MLCKDNQDSVDVTKGQACQIKSHLRFQLDLVLL